VWLFCLGNGVATRHSSLDLAASVIAKSGFAGRPVRRQGGVLFIAAEGQDEVRPRLQGVVHAKIQTAIAKPIGDRSPINDADLPFAWCEQCPRLVGDQALDELRQLVRKAYDRLLARGGFPLALIIIDTLMSAAGFERTNDWAEAQEVMNLLRAIAREFGVLVLVVDHFGKDESKGTAGAMNKEGAADAVLAALGNKALAGKVTNTRLAFRKVRGGKQGAEVHFSTRLVTLGMSPEGEVIDTLVIEWGAPGEREGGGFKIDWPKGLRLFRMALESCLMSNGEVLRPDPNGEECRVVDRKRVREEFMATSVSDKPDTKRKAYVRSEQQALTDGLILSRVIEFGGVLQSVFWIPDSLSEAAGT
jgi:hypothetical protein